jgi:hypothetical protein
MHLPGTLRIWTGIAEELVQTKDTKYEPFIRAQDKPAIWLNKATMDKYRPEMKKYYYDPSRFKTYLDQLGIKYPTLNREPASNPEPTRNPEPTANPEPTVNREPTVNPEPRTNREPRTLNQP